MELYNLNNIKLVLNVIINYYLHIQSTMYLVLVLSQYSRQYQAESDLYHCFFHNVPLERKKTHLERSEYSEKSPSTWLLLRLTAMLSKELSGERCKILTVWVKTTICSLPTPFDDS